MLGCDVHGLLEGAAFSLLRLPKSALRLPSSPSPSFFLLRRPMVACGESSASKVWVEVDCCGCG